MPCWKLKREQNQILTEINSIFNNQTTPSEAEVELVNHAWYWVKPLTTFSWTKKSKPNIHPFIGSLMHNISGDPDPKLTVGSFTVQDEWFNKTSH